MSKGANLYSILGVDPKCDEVVIHAAYRGLMRRYNPEVNKQPDAAVKVQQINAAYATLGNARKRSNYDAGLLIQPEKPAEPPPATGQPEPSPAESPVGPAAVNETPAISRRLVFTVAGAIAVVTLVVYTSPPSPKRFPPDSLVDAPPPSVKVDAPEKPPAKKPVEIPLDGELKFADAANCVASPQLDGVFESMLPMSDQSSGFSPRSVNVAGKDIKPQMSDIVGVDDPEGTVAKSSFVRVPPSSTWHGLKVARLVASYYAPPETDSSYSRSITFFAPAERVRAVLGELGFNPPAAGGYSTLTNEACGGSMEIKPIPGGTELRCSWGC